MQNNFWKNKVVIITGSSMGIGKKIAEEIGKMGAIIILNARNAERLKSTKTFLTEKRITAEICAGDVSVYNNCKQLSDFAVNKFGKIDVLINNAGISNFSKTEDVKPEVFKNVIDVNLTGSVYMTKAVLPHIKKTKGSILFMGSLAGIHGIGEYAAYSGSKSALTAVTESLRIELHNTGIHIGIAYVGFTENDPNKTFLDKNGNNIPLPSRDNVRQVPVEKVAKRLIRMIEKRKKSSTFTLLGKMNKIVNTISPSLIHFILLNNYKKTK